MCGHARDRRGLESLYCKPVGSIKKYPNEDSVISNFGSEDHPPLEKAEALQNLKNRTGKNNEQIAEICGISAGYVGQLLGLIKLSSDVKALLDPNLHKQKRLPTQSAIRLAAFPSYLHLELAEEIIERKMGQREAGYFLSGKSHEKGISIPGRTPNRDYNIVTGFVRRCLSQAQLVLQIPDSVFEKMFESRSDTERTTFMEQLKKLETATQKILNKFSGTAK